MAVISEIYRPFVDPSFMDGLREVAGRRFASTVQLAEPSVYNALRVELINPGSLATMADASPLHRGGPAASLRGALPQSFDEPVPVTTRGVTYLPDRYGALLIIKFNSDEPLRLDTTGILYGLHHFGVRPSGRQLYNAVVGNVELDMLHGKEKVQLRHSLSDATPRILWLAPGVIETR